MILDGAVGTELWGRGIDTAGALWSANAIRPGARGSRLDSPRLCGGRGHGSHGGDVSNEAPVRGGELERLARRAVAIAREAVPEGHRIAGSIAPLEDCYRPDQAPTDSSLLVREHGELARALVDAGVDLLLAETFAAPHEAVAATEACVATGVETWVALTAGPRADLLTPAALAEAARRCVDAGARAVLVNCVPATKTLAYVEALARVGAPFGAYANAGDMEEGLGWVAANEARGPAVRYAELARTWASAGATILGGCCGTGPTHIEALAQMLSVRAPPTSAPRAGE